MSRRRRRAAPVGPHWRGYARAAVIALAAVTPAALLGPSCALGGFERVPEPEVQPDASDPGPCTRLELPGPPEVGSGGDLSVVSAFNSVDLGEASGSPAIGLDLDRTCTCPESATCTPIVPGTPEACDAPGGRDNAATSLFRLIGASSQGTGFGSDYYTNMIEQGFWSVLLRVRGYNGQQNDRDVILDWYVAPNRGGAPAWDGTDVWPVQQDSVLGDDPQMSPKYTDPNAYVSNHTLIASLPDVPIRLGEGYNTISIRISGAFVVAEIGAPEGGTGFALVRGTLVGRWTLAEVFNSVSSYRADGQPFCMNSPFYAIARAQLCAAADILSVPGSPSTPCDALSIGIGFTALPAVLGGIDMGMPDGGPVITDCIPGTDPAEDSCDKL